MKNEPLKLSIEVLDRAKRITLLILDVDGVLTDGKIYYGNHGDVLQKFDVQDGMGMYLWYQAGMKSVIISGRRSKIIPRRAKEMRIGRVFQGVENKEKAYEAVLRKWDKRDEETCFIGDDLIDLPLLRRVGLAVAVPNAVREIRESADYVTRRSGGDGAVREIVDLLLKAKGEGVHDGRETIPDTASAVGTGD